MVGCCYWQLGTPSIAAVAEPRSARSSASVTTKITDSKFGGASQSDDGIAKMLVAVLNASTRILVSLMCICNTGFSQKELCRDLAPRQPRYVNVMIIFSGGGANVAIPPQKSEARRLCKFGQHGALSTGACGGVPPGLFFLHLSFLSGPVHPRRDASVPVGSPSSPIACAARPDTDHGPWVPV